MPINFGTASTMFASARDSQIGRAVTNAFQDIYRRQPAAFDEGMTIPGGSSGSSSAFSFTPSQNIGFATQAINGILGNIAQNRANRQGARALREQAGIYDSMAGVQLSQADIQAQGAGMYAKQAAAAADLGRGNARNIRLAAAQLDRYEQLHLREAVLNARRRIGQGRAGFAANGVLVDSGSAAMWEQDETADAALERLDIMQQYEDQSWNYLMQANKAEAEGYAAAAQQMGAAAAAAGQAAGMAGEAYATKLQAASARAQAARMKNKKSWGATIGTVVGAVAGSFAGNPAAGAAIGSQIGGVYDAYRS